MKKKFNLHIYPSPFKNESRILKETKTLIDAGIVDEITIIGTYSDGLPRHEIIDSQRKVHRIKTIFDSLPKNIISDISRFYAFQTVIFFKYLFKRIDYINCHSLSVLPVGVFLKILKKTKLVYDAHELETERAGLKGKKQKLSKILEKSLFPFVDSTIVVTNSINRWYRKEYNTGKVYTVRNVPDLRFDKPVLKKNVLKEKFGISQDELLYIYQGLLGKGRGIETLLKVFTDPKVKAHIVFMGYGIHEEKIKEYSNKYSRIHFQEAVHPNQIIEYSSSADVGICLIENIGLSYYYCLPNKVFEYSLAGIPIIVSDFPELAEYVDSVKCGWKIQPDEMNLKMLVSAISLAEIESIKNKMKGIRKSIGWHFEEEELKKAYTKP